MAGPDATRPAAPMPYLWMFFIFCILGALTLCVMM